MSWIDIISAGPGDAKLLTIRAREALEAAETVFCAARHAALAGDESRIRPLTPFAEALEQMEACGREGRRIAVLVSGDAGLYSLLPTVTERFGRDAVCVYPGVSSLQAFCARLGIPWQDACILSAHGRELTPSALCRAVGTHRRTLLLMDGNHDPRWLRNTLKDGGLENVRITVGERISYPDERIGLYEEEREYDPLAVALVENDRPAPPERTFALPDSAFIRGGTPMTKREIRAQIAAELNLPADAVVWDIGAGTGSVTVECALQCPLGQVYAVERDVEALELIEKNIRQFSLLNAEIISGTAPEALENLPAPTHVFLGGTGGKTAEILALLDRMPAPVRLCATAVTLESIREFTELLGERKGFSAVQIAVSRIEKAGAYHMLRAQNPVYLFSAEVGKE